MDNNYFTIFGFDTVVVHTDIPQVGGDSSLGEEYVGKTNNIFCQTKNRIPDAEMGRTVRFSLASPAKHGIQGASVSQVQPTRLPGPLAPFQSPATQRGLFFWVKRTLVSPRSPVIVLHELRFQFLTFVTH